MAQLICRYRKGDQVRWISHLDLKRTLERAMRRAQLPLELTRGHNPHPKLSFGPPLPLGATGEAELVAIRLTEPIAPDQLKQRLNEQLPSGIEIAEAWILPAYKRKETFGDIDIAEYRVAISGAADAEQVGARIAQLLERERLVVRRGGQRPEREVDLRPFILTLDISQSGPDETELRMRLRTGSHGGARPQEIISLLGLENEDCVVRYHRTGLYAAAEFPSPRPTGLLRRWARSRTQKERS